MEHINISPWHISCREADDAIRSYRESIFSQGNGYMGIRGYRPDEQGCHKAWRSTFLAGFFEYIRPGITDMVNQPDFSAAELCLDGMSASSMRMEEFCQTMSLRDGVVTWSFILENDRGGGTQVEIKRFLSMADKHLAGIHYRITPINCEETVSLLSGIDADVENLPIADNQMESNTQMLRLWKNAKHTNVPLGGALTVETKTSGRKVAMAYTLISDWKDAVEEEIRRENYVGTKLSVHLNPGEAWQIDKLIAVASFRDTESPEDYVADKLTAVKHDGFDALLQENHKAWEAVWEDADVALTGNDVWQGAVRYNISQLIQATPEGDEHASIGARGLAHGRYKGCYFWDTEIFMLPFLRYTRPQAARSLLMYRFNTMQDALESAKRFSTKGARFSWMSSDTGFEQCETWDTGCCEIHITADIAYAIGKYIEQAGDEAFLREYGAELLIQTARYWVDRFSYCQAEDKYHLLFVKGPDEYCGVTTDDFYTVKMAAHNLLLAGEAVKRMGREYPEAWKALQNKLSFCPEEPSLWHEITEKTVLQFDEEKKLWMQDSTFAYLEPLDVSACKEGNIPLYHKFSFDRLQRYQVLKQPAVLMYMALRPEEFSEEEVRAAWNYYEPITLHDSTLSFGVHAMMAAKLGLREKAVAYFEKSMFLDLRNVMCNTGNEGIHTASLGATWQALILGFAGISVTNGKIKCTPHLPEQIQSMEFQIYHRGQRYRVHVGQGNSATIKSV